MTDKREIPWQVGNLDDEGVGEFKSLTVRLVPEEHASDLLELLEMVKNYDGETNRAIELSEKLCREIWGKLESSGLVIHSVNDGKTYCHCPQCLIICEANEHICDPLQRDLVDGARLIIHLDALSYNARNKEIRINSKENLIEALRLMRKGLERP